MNLSLLISECSHIVAVDLEHGSLAYLQVAVGLRFARRVAADQVFGDLRVLFDDLRPRRAA